MGSDDARQNFGNSRSVLMRSASIRARSQGQKKMNKVRSGQVAIDRKAGTQTQAQAGTGRHRQADRGLHALKNVDDC